MFVFMLLSLSVATQDSSARHVRSAEARILRLIDAGISGSATFRGLIGTLNESDVVVYIEPKRTRQALGGYLAHSIVAQGQYRYLHIAVEIAGAERRLVSLLAHELQHAVEVARTPDARDAEGLEQMFSRIAIKFGCGATSCLETQDAKDVEHMVNEELAESARTTSTRLGSVAFASIPRASASTAAEQAEVEAPSLPPTSPEVTSHYERFWNQRLDRLEAFFAQKGRTK